MFKFTICTLSVMLLLACFGCSKYTLQNNKGWKLSNESRTTPSTFRNFRTGHLLIKGEGSVLTLDIRKKSLWDVGKTDVSTCSHIRVEMPLLDKQTLPITIKDPKSYLQTCSCTWGDCKEDSLAHGHVEITDITADGLAANLNLVFSSSTIRKNGFFVNQNPSWISIYDETEIPTDVIKSWRALQIH